jgi:hypothetical protein
MGLSNEMNSSIRFLALTLFSLFSIANSGMCAESTSNDVIGSERLKWAHYTLRVFGCQFPIPISYEVSLRSLDDAAISFTNSELAVGGSIKVSAYQGERNWESIEPASISPQQWFANLDGFQISQKLLPGSSSKHPIRYVRITDLKQEVVLVGAASEYWQDMMQSCVRALETESGN